MYLSIVKNLEIHVSLGSSIFQNLLNCYTLWLYKWIVIFNSILQFYDIWNFQFTFIYIIFIYKDQQIKSSTFFFKSKQKLFFVKFNIMKIDSHRKPSGKEISKDN